MVKNLIKKSKRGIAMIELIFALVIMGIVLMSAPMLIQQSIKSGNVALQQEAIAAAASHTSMLLSLHWDESNTKYQAGISPILRTGTGIVLDGLTDVTGRNNLDSNNSEVNATAIGLLGKDTTDDILDDVDDYNDKPVSVNVFTHADGTEESSRADVGDYIDVNLSIDTTVYYADNNISNNFSLQTQSSNIKFINVNLTSKSGIDELDKNITMKAFSCNIGTTAPQDGGEKN